MPQLEAIIWDVDGTLADTERDGHLVAFNQAFETEGLPWRWDEVTYCRLLSVTGGRERLLADMAQRPEAPQAPDARHALAVRLHALKNLYYADLVEAGQVALRPGVLALVDECLEHSVRLAIATTTSRTNLETLLHTHFRGRWSGCFEHIVCGEDVRRKKPDPEVYKTVLSSLGLHAPQCLAIEDSPGGAAAALAANVPVVVTRSACFALDIFEGAAAIGHDLGAPSGWSPPATRVTAQGTVGLEQLRTWHAQATSAS